MLHKLLVIFQVVSAVLVMIVILMQGRGTSLGEAFGGSNVFHGARRGAEKSLFIITIVIAVFFIVFSILQLFF